MTLEELATCAVMANDKTLEQLGEALWENRKLKKQIAKLEAVAKATKDLIGPNQIGRTVDTSVKFEGVISACMHGEALWKAVKALAELEKE